MADEATAKDLIAAAASGPDAVLDIARGTTEQWRRSVAPDVVAWYRRTFPDPWPPVPCGPAIAMLAVGSLDELRKCKLADQREAFGQEAVAALVDRRPAWLASWSVLTLERRRSNFSGVNAWAATRHLVRAGVLERPATPAYTLLMIHGIRGLKGDVSAPPGERLTLQELLRSDPGLLEAEIWQLFEVEGRPRPGANLTATKRWWQHALLVLMKEGLVSRERLLDATLGALASGFSAYNNRWYIEFLDALAPTDAELKARVDPALSLLSQPDAMVVKLGLRHVKAFVTSGDVEATTLATAVAPVIGSLPKVTARAALQLLRLALADEARPWPAAVMSTLTDALGHGDPDVQRTTLALIERAGPVDEASAQELRSASDGVAAPLRERAAAVVGAPDVHHHLMASDIPTVNVLLDRAHRLPVIYATAAGVPDAIGTFRGERDMARVVPDRRTLPLDPSAALAPVTDAVELVDLFVRLIEDASDVDQLERALAGLARLGAAPATEFRSRCAPLLKRADAIAKGRAGRQVGALEHTVARMLAAWDEGSELPGYERALRATSWRMHEVLDTTRRGQAIQLLSEPTHRGGFIAADVLARRLRHRVLGPGSIGLGDAVFALLRVVAQGSEAALSILAGVGGELAQALRYALGGTAAIGPTIPLWAAASRARDPYGIDPTLASAHPGLGPDAAEPARLRLAVGQHYENKVFVVTCEPPLPTETTPGLFVQAPLAITRVDRHGFRGEDGLGYGSLARWALRTWPMNREAYFACGLDAAGYPREAALELLLDPDERVGPMAVALLACGLTSVPPSTRQLATDVFIAAAGDGRIIGAELGEVVGAMWEAGVLVPARVAGALAMAARVSPLHTSAVTDVLQAAVATHPTPRGLHAVLEVLVDCALPLARPMKDPAARAALTAVGSSSKAGRLAKVLLGIDAAPKDDQTDAERLALLVRIERAERWSAWAAGPAA
jgi:hypothetical protein